MHHVAASPSGQHLATAHVDGSVRVWDSSTLARCAPLDMAMIDEAGCVMWSPDSKRIVGGSYDKILIVWDAATGCELGRLNGHTEAVSSVTFSPDGLRIASGAFDCSLRLWDATAGGAYQELRTIEVEGGFNFVHSVAFSPSSTRVAAGLADHTMRVWDPATGNELRRLGGHTSSVITVAYSPCGRWLSSGSKDHSIRVWNVDTGEVQRTLEGHGDHVMSVAYSLNYGGARLVSSANNVVRVWDMTSGLCVLTLEGHTEDVTSVVFSQDGSHVFSVSLDLTIRKWSTSSGECVYVVDVLELDLARLVGFIKNGLSTELDLSFSFLRDHHVSTIIETLTAPGCLVKSLSLRYCKLSPGSILAIAEAVKVNESLQTVNFQGNPMTGPEHASMAAALQINYTVTAVTLGDGVSESDQALINAALEANTNLTTRDSKKDCFYLRLQREGIVPVSKPAKVVA